MADPIIRRRLPATEKKISEIQPETDVRVKIIGTVIGSGESSLLIDDGSGKIEVVFDEQLNYLDQGQLVKVITRVLPLIDGFECKGECVQILDNFNVDLYRKAKSLIK